MTELKLFAPYQNHMVGNPCWPILQSRVYVLQLMEIDTGAAVTLISLVRFNRHFTKMTLSPSSARLSTYTGQKISVCGEIKVKGMGSK